MTILHLRGVWLIGCLSYGKITFRMVRKTTTTTTLIVWLRFSMCLYVFWILSVLVETFFLCFNLLNTELKFWVIFRYHYFCYTMTVMSIYLSNYLLLRSLSRCVLTSELVTISVVPLNSEKLFYHDLVNL